MNIEAKKRLLPGDWVATDQAVLELEAKDVGTVDEETGNERIKLHLNIPSKTLYFEVTDKLGVPMVVTCFRADQELLALGLLEKIKDAVKLVNAKKDTKAQLATGVGRLSDQLGNLKLGGRA